MFSQRTNWEHAPNRLMAAFESRTDSGAEIINLTESNPTRCGFSYPSDTILAPLSDTGNLAYDPSPRGALAARQALTSFYAKRNHTLDPQRIFLTASTSEAYSFLLRLLTNPGERILVPRPGYPLFDYLAQVNDVGVDTYSLRYADGWHVDYETVTRAIGKGTKAVIVVNPNNPTGSFVTCDELDAISALCARHGIALISDEVFWQYDIVGSPQRMSAFTNTAPLTFTMSGASKLFGLPQMKVAWTAVSGPSQAVDDALRRLDIILDTYLSVSTPAQHALAHWLSKAACITDEITARLKENHHQLMACFSPLARCRCRPAEGGWYAVVRLPDQLTEEQWALEFLEKDGVFVHPGYFFDFEDEPFMVMSLLPKPEVFFEGIKRLANRVQDVVS